MVPQISKLCGCGVIVGGATFDFAGKERSRPQLLTKFVVREKKEGEKKAFAGGSAERRFAEGKGRKEGRREGRRDAVVRNGARFTTPMGASGGREGECTVRAATLSSARAEGRFVPRT